MANKITIQHLYTTGTTAAPAANALTLGEIAISAGKDKEGIYFKNNNDEVVKVLTSAQTRTMILETAGSIEGFNEHIKHKANNREEYEGNNPYGHVRLVIGDLSGYTNGQEDGVAAAAYHTHGQYLTNVTPGSGQPIVSIIEDGIAKIGLTTGITNQINSGVSGYTRIENHEPKSGTTEEIGHVKLVGGDLSGKTGNVIDGEAAASHHIHSQYIAKDDISNGLEIWKKNNDATKEQLRVKAAPNGGITVDDSGVSINVGYQSKIESGVTAYGWGNHADFNYASDEDLLSHRNNNSIHVSQDKKNEWDAAANRINTFLDVQSGATEALDSLYEIQEYLTGSGNSVNTLLDSLNKLTDTVSENTNDINNISGIVSTNTDDINKLETSVDSKVFKISAPENDSLITSSSAVSGSGLSYTITHLSASTQDSAITATNDTTGLSFGSEFKIVDNIGYDKNGHVVSGSTQTLKLPKLPDASETNSGVVKLKTGTFTQAEELLNENKDYLTTAASIAHGHTEYVKLTALSPQNTSTGNTITISCGTY